MRRTAHRLADLVRDLRSDTVIAVCDCGWRSVPARSEAAMSAIEHHVLRRGSAHRAA